MSGWVKLKNLGSDANLSMPTLLPPPPKKTGGPGAGKKGGKVGKLALRKSACSVFFLLPYNF